MNEDEDDEDEDEDTSNVDENSDIDDDEREWRKGQEQRQGLLVISETAPVLPSFTWHLFWKPGFFLPGLKKESSDSVSYCNGFLIVTHSNSEFLSVSCFGQTFDNREAVRQLESLVYFCERT
jgi:hypothetical protein